MSKSSVRRWYHWFSPEDTPEERRLILKLDLLILPYAFVIYWVKYIDQTNISKLAGLHFSCLPSLSNFADRQCLCLWDVDGSRFPRQPIGPIPNHFRCRECGWPSTFRLSLPKSSNVLACTLLGSWLGNLQSATVSSKQLRGNNGLPLHGFHLRGKTYYFL
jgi:hypothetical protein